MNYIYALIDPRDSRIRYIGKSTNPKKRLGVHLRDGGGSFIALPGYSHCSRSAWSRSLRSWKKWLPTQTGKSTSDSGFRCTDRQAVI